MDLLQFKYTIGDMVFDTTCSQMRRIIEARVFINPGNKQPMVSYRVENPEFPTQVYEREEGVLAKSPAEAVRQLNEKLQRLMRAAERAAADLRQFLEALPDATKETAIMAGEDNAPEESQEPQQPLSNG